MKFKRPKLSVNPLNSTKIAYDAIGIREEPYTGIKYLHEISYIEYISPNPDGSVPFTIRENVSDNIINKHIAFSELTHRCTRIAESLNRQLISFLRSYYLNNPSKVASLLNLDFMRLRDRLSDIIKNDKSLHNLEQLNTKDKRKKFTSVFFGFIEDRNIYTHGHLHVRLDDMAIVITYIDKAAGRYVMCEVDEEVFESYFEIFNYLSVTLNVMNGIHEVI